MVFNAIFNNISVTSWWSVLIMEETGVPRGNHWHATSHWQTLSCNVASGTPRLSRIRTHKKQVWDLILTRLVVQDKSNTQHHPLDGTEIKIFVFKSTHKNDYFAAANNVQKCVVSEWSMVACCVWVVNGGLLKGKIFQTYLLYPLFPMAI
jgi:hypothetical protein